MKLLFSATVFCCLAVPAFAADLPVDMSELNPQPLPPIAEADADDASDESEGTGATDSRVTITNENFASESGECEFDLWAVLDDGKVQTVEQLDTCAVGELSFTS